MGEDIVDLLEKYVAADKPDQWAKLSSTVMSRRLELLLLREILIELRSLRKELGLTKKTDDQPGGARG